MMKLSFFAAAVWVVCLFEAKSSLGVTKARPQASSGKAQSISVSEAKRAEADFLNIMTAVGSAGNPPQECSPVPPWQQVGAKRRALGYDSGTFSWELFRKAFREAVNSGSRYRFTGQGSRQPLICSPSVSLAHPILTGMVHRPEANLKAGPSVDQINTHSKDHEVTLGDLHGNPMKLIYFLVSEGVLRPKAVEGQSPERLLREIYQDLYFTYQEGPHANLDLFSRFKEHLDRFEVAHPSPRVRLIGDDTGDRGENDFFTLQVLDKLHQAKAPFEILASNHGMEFIRYCERELIENKTIQDSEWGIADPKQMSSLLNLRSLAEKHPPLKQQVKELYERVYRPHLTLLSYSVKEGALALYSHAPIGFEGLSSLTENFGISECAERQVEASKKALIDCVGKVNAKFAEVRDRNGLSELFDRQRQEVETKLTEIEEQKEQGKPESGPLERSKWGFRYTLWNQDLSGVNRKSNLKDSTSIDWVHGHYRPQNDNDKKWNAGDHIQNLDEDNYLGYSGERKKSSGELMRQTILKSPYVTYHFDPNAGAEQSPAEKISR